MLIPETPQKYQYLYQYILQYSNGIYLLHFFRKTNNMYLESTQPQVLNGEIIYAFKELIVNVYYNVSNALLFPQWLNFLRKHKQENTGYHMLLSTVTNRQK